MTALGVVSVILYLSALMAYLMAFIRKRHSMGIIGYRLVLVGLAAHTLSIIQRWHLAGRPPVANMHESMVLFAWAVIAIGALLERGYRLGCFGSAIVFLGLVLFGGSRLWPDAILPLVPALKSPWLFWHVASCMLAYGALAIGWLAGGLYLVVGHRRTTDEARLRLQAIDALAYHATAFGFLMLAGGIITGSIWANLAWGSWWSWDPKETWALITWLTYAIYLHHRLAMKWHPEKLAWFSVCAFPLVLFTFLGVNYLLVGLHSYAG
jgi:cytochrome c-type biogenesis protein CcsB